MVYHVDFSGFNPLNQVYVFNANQVDNYLPFCRIEF